MIVGSGQKILIFLICIQILCIRNVFSYIHMKQVVPLIQVMRFSSLLKFLLKCELKLFQTIFNIKLNVKQVKTVQCGLRNCFILRYVSKERQLPLLHSHTHIQITYTHINNTFYIICALTVIHRDINEIIFLTKVLIFL